LDEGEGPRASSHGTSLGFHRLKNFVGQYQAFNRVMDALL